VFSSVQEVSGGLRKASYITDSVATTTASAAQMDSLTRERFSVGTQEIGLGLSTGTRLRARLESAASTAVRPPVLAVVEYTYERDGQIIVPAGAKPWGEFKRPTDQDTCAYNLSH